MRDSRKDKPPPYRLLTDENTSPKLVAACRRLVRVFLIVQLAAWRGGAWLGFDAAARLAPKRDVVLVLFDRATLPWHAGQVLRAGEDHGIGLLRRSVRSTDYGSQARLLTEFWASGGLDWDWRNRIVYLPKAS
jgi:hypothetical protein